MVRQLHLSMAPDPMSQGIAKLAILYPFTIGSLLLTFFFLFNGSVLFPEWEELGLDRWIMAYLIFQVAALAIARQQLSQLPLPLSMVWFAGGFLGAYTLFTIMFAGGGIEQPFPVTGTILGVVAFQFVVAASEEAAFRGILVRDFRPGVPGAQKGPLPIATWVTIIVGALAFTGFHLAAYTQLAGGFQITSFIFPFMFGSAMGYTFIKTRSISLTIAIHWAYNLAVLGISPF